ncbi:MULTISPECIES: D-ribose ABC transporter substrate-binding protein [Thermus]|jgi:ribose transport system substrate-binding protein|uniref:D-ribose ABC transporter substrate-binding protein n=1 Tax=Thermus caliditerrae TaxID=1330700 RepID=A0A7C5REY9_9DEIN|nr:MULTISPECIES: D-ribose ABC transporter substrate-binding protein [Thermus]KHG65698.1 D-ribose transporter subunit RbsB [Thermus sp. 2.9]BCZ90660.1 D-ribose ABC transporter substrate-binding protein [Thermus thermophilus]
MARKVGVFGLAIWILASAAALAQGAVVGLSLSTLNNPFFVALRDGALQAAQKAGIQLVVLDAQDRVDKQVADIEDLIQRRVRVLLVNPTDSAAVVPAIQRANQAGIPVITVDRAASGGKVAYHIASDNVAGGRMAAEFICNLLKGRGKVVELEGIPGTSAARDRGQGFNAYLKEKCPGVTVVARQTANFDRAQGLSVMENILQAQRDIDAVFAHNDEMALGALQAIKASGRKIPVVGFDATPDAVKAVEACEMAATVAQQPAEMGRFAVEKAVELIRGAKAPAQTQFIPVPLKLVTNPRCNW